MKLDQHFLQDDEVAKLAVSLCKIRKSDAVVEIGPGHGELTKFIPECNLTIIEKDEKLLKGIKKDAKKIHGDGVDNIKNREFDYLISSVPYAICEPLFRELILHHFKKAVLILPESFVKKMEGNETSLSFLKNEFLDVRKIKRIGKEKFSPVPKTDSFIVEVRKKQGSPVMEKMSLQPTKKTKNALREAIADSTGRTKKQARGVIEKMGLNKRTLEKNVRMLSFHELRYIKDTTKKLLQ